MTTPKRRLARLLGVTVISAATLFGFSSPAFAGRALDCNDGYICIYKDINWVNLLEKRFGGFGLTNVPHQSNDKMSSWDNSYWGWGAWYVDANGKGRCYGMVPRGDNSWIGPFDNDKLTSWRGDHGC